MNTRISPLHPFLILLAALALSGPSARAAGSNSWNVNADGNWDVASNWLGGVNIPGSTTTDNSDIATFSFTLTAAHAVTVDANRYIGGISFGNTSAFGYTLGTGILHLNNGGVIQTLAGNGAHTDTISSAITLDGGSGSTATFTGGASSTTSVLSITGGITGTAAAAGTTTLTLNGTNTGTATVANTISGIIGNGGNGGNVAIVKDDAGTWALSGNNTYTGTTTVSAGTLRVGDANALGATSAGTVVNSGATLQLTKKNATYAAEPLTLNGSGVSGGGALLDAVGTGGETFAGAITLASDATITASGAGSTLTMTGGLTTATAGDKTLTLNGSGKLAFTTGNITNGGSGQKINIITSSGGGVSFSASTLATSGNITTTSGGVNVLGAENGFTGTWTVQNGASINFNGGGIANAAGLVMEAGSTLSFRNQPATVAVTKLKGAVTINGGAFPGDTQTYASKFSDFDGSNPGSLTISTGAINLSGSFAVTLSSAAGNDFSGGLTVLNNSAATTTRYGMYINPTAVNVLGTGVVTLNSSATGGTTGTAYAGLYLGANQTIAGLSSTILANNEAWVTANNTTVRTVTLNGNTGGTNTFAGTIGSRINGSGANDVNIALIKSGNSTQILSGANAYTGSTTVSAGTLLVSAGGLTGTSGITVSGGTLQLGASNMLRDAATMTLSGGTLNAQGFTDTVGVLTLSGNSFISLSGSGALAFADSHLATWGAFTIDITGFVSGTSLRFGNSNAGLSAGQLGKFTASGFNTFGLDSSGYLTAVPEPATWALLAFSLTTVMVLRRRRNS